jgi:tRNA A-37 threonylcarbamoyl transferase component Bud32
LSGRIDEACDRFERAWRAGPRIQIEDILAQTPPEQRPRLLGELLEIELDCRQRAGEFLRLEDFCRRFAEQADLVEAVFRRVVKNRRLGDYELLDELGQGGMGVVYKARQVYLNQTVAVKVLPERYLDDSQAVARFRREMQSIGALDHANIVRAYNAGEAGGAQFLVMEYVDGIDLQHLVCPPDRPPQPLSVGAACAVIHQAALGLEHAHQHQLVHRDIKPANLMLSRAGTVKLLDLGLAKFHAERGQPDQQSSELTRAGVTMGTVDYMAPEQWESSGSVDIRADIYSLGCTLFFLLAGQPPYGGKAYDSNRKKLMAHVVAPIPSLAAYRPDCPPELDQLLTHMMAKEPADRFASPGEVAQALEPLADASELAGLVAAHEVADQVTLGGLLDIEGYDPDTAGRLARQSAARQSAKRSAAGRQTIGPKAASTRREGPRPWYRRAGPLVSGAVALALAVGFGVWLGTRGNRPAPILPAPPPALDRQKLALELALLPGLNGEWWFDEIPWFVPFVRQAVAAGVEPDPDPLALLANTPAEYLDPNVAEVQRWLWDVTERVRSGLSPDQGRLLDELKALAESRLDDQQLAQSLTQSIRRQTAGRGPGDQPAGAWPALQRHTLAVLEHGAAALANDRPMAEAAKKSYDEALAAYLPAAGPAPPLRALCLADLARLHAEVLDNQKEAVRCFDQALAVPGLPPLFRVETLTACGDAAAAGATTAGEYQDHRFLSAKRILAASEAGKRSHPLAAHVAERYAWSLMDQWKVEEAAKEFHEAYNIRWINQREKNPFATIHLFHDRHGLAMTERYRGNVEAARRLYQALVEEVKAALDEAGHRQTPLGGRQFMYDLRDRWTNSMERWADCELYCGAASGQPVNLAQACALYEKARRAATDLGTALVMSCKLAIAQALHGQPAEARKVLAELDAGKKEILGTDRQRSGLARQVADAVLRLKEQGPGDGQKALRAFLDQFRLNPNYTDRGRRETLELQLFAAELLLASDLEANDAPSASRDLKYLDPLLETFRGRGDMRPFLRRYYELAIRSCDRADLVQMAHYLLASRMVQQQEQLRSRRVTLLLFLFAAKQNFAIFLPQDGRGGKLIPLELTRQQVKEAASRGKSLHLDDALVKLVKEELQAGRSIELSWSDTMSRPSGDDRALSDSEWPFGDQLPLAALKKKG